MTGQFEDGGSPCTLVVPCYNEALRLPLDSFRTFLTRTQGVRLLFVNDGSKDATLQVLYALQAEFPELIDVVDQPRNQGKAEAVRTGMIRALQVHHATYVGYWDADLATPLDELPRLQALLVEKPGVEIILGSRVRLLGRYIHRKSMRHYAGRVFATLASITLALHVYDTQCGSKLFRVTPTLSQILIKPFLSRWTFDVEILARFLQLHPGSRELAIHAIYEEPLQAWEDVGGSKLKLQDAIKAIADLLMIRRMYPIRKD